MEEDIHNSSLVKRFGVDGIHNGDTVEWSKKRKPQSDQLDLHRPKHKFWDGNSSAEHATMLGKNPKLESMHIHLINGRIEAATSLNDSSECESARDSNSFIEDSNSTAMSIINEEGKVEADSANARPSNIFIDWDGCEKVKSSSEEDEFVDNKCKCDQNYQYAELNALKNLKEQFLGLGNQTDHRNSEYAKEIVEESMDEKFEDIGFSKGENPNIFILSSGRWKVNQEVQSSKKPPTIDQEFEQYFSMLML